MDSMCCGKDSSNTSGAEPWRLQICLCRPEGLLHPVWWKQKSLPCSMGGFSLRGRALFYFAGCCWSVVGVGAVDDEASCSRLFFRRLISTRPPEIRLGLVVVSPAVACTGALP